MPDLPYFISARSLTQYKCARYKSVAQSIYGMTNDFPSLLNPFKQNNELLSTRGVNFQAKMSRCV